MLATNMAGAEREVPSVLHRFASYARKHLVKYVAVALAFMIVFMPELFAHASTTITIDTDVLFANVNTWIDVFLPIAAIGLGIAIALAVIGFVGDAVLSGFKRAR